MHTLHSRKTLPILLRIPINAEDLSFFWFYNVKTENGLISSLTAILPIRRAQHRVHYVAVWFTGTSIVSVRFRLT